MDGTQLFTTESTESLTIASQFRVQRLAHLAHLSRRQFGRRFNQTYGYSPQKWLAEQRIALAKKFLLEDVPVKVVALELHCKYAAHFCRDFKRATGMTPLQFVAAARR